MQFFTTLEGVVLLKQRGVYREGTLLRNDKGELFVKYGSGAARLYPSQATTVNGLYWSEIRTNQEYQVKGPHLVLTEFVEQPVKKKAA